MPAKDPKARIAVINDAGRAKIPNYWNYRIGENEEETVRSLEKIRELHNGMATYKRLSYKTLFQNLKR